MRCWIDHRFEGDDFQESMRGIVRNAPWWSISGVVHLLVLLVLWQIPVINDRPAPAPTMQATLPETADDIVEDKEPPPVDPPLDPDPQHDPVDVPDVQTTEDIEQPFDEPVGETGDSTGPLEGPSIVTSIGVAGGGGGGKGRGSWRTGKGMKGSGQARIKTMQAGLQWLAKHQDVDGDGKWDCDDFMKHDPAADRCDGPGNQLYDVGVTGLALLAFLGAGYTDRGLSTDPYVLNVRKGLRFLIRVQDEEGCFGARTSKHFMYNHGIAALAMAEAYWMTRNVRYKQPAQKALDFIARARNSYAAWRYEPRGGENDLSVTGWMVMALKSGKYAGLLIDPDAFEGARRFVAKMTDPEFGVAGYDMPGGGSARPEGLQDRFPPEKTASMTAVAVLTRIFLGEEPGSEMIRKGSRICRDHLPRWDPEDGSIDMYYWYYGTLAMFQVGGTTWKEWNKAMVPAVVQSQHKEGSGSREGSWDPIGPWGHDGGRVYSTALMVLCLEVYFRYDRVFGIKRR